MRIVAAEEVRAAIAEHMLGASAPRTELGEVTLHAHQWVGLERVTRLLEQHRGALLADDVGLGKTFVALAAARAAADALVVAPAALRELWTSAARRAGVSVRFVSMDSLSRQGAPRADPRLVIVDEAHHFRSRRTRRFVALSALCRVAPVLLMTATPVQNRLADLRALLSLFLGERAWCMDADELSTFVVRRLGRDIAVEDSVKLPAVRPPEWLGPLDDVDCLDRLVALPPPLPPLDGGNGGILLTYTLVRQWSSSRAALRGALQRRLARAHAMEDTLAAGRIPSRAEISAWCYADGAQQLSLPELTVQAKISSPTELLAQVREHADGLRELLTWVGHTPDPDLARAEALHDLMRRHAGERVVAFSEYADTVSALYRMLAPSTRAAMLTHGGGRVAGGAVKRREILLRFAPGSSRRIASSDRIDILLTTDVLSEGVSLHDASVVVHLDLSWNPARLEQRVGRLRRIGASRDAISVYAFAPPAPAERLLQLDRRLRVKLGVAGRAMGVAGTILPGFVSDRQSAPALRAERLAVVLRSWRRDGGARATNGPVCGTARSRHAGALACVRIADTVSLFGIVGEEVSGASDALEPLLADAGGESVPISPVEIGAAREQLERWLRRREISQVIDLAPMRVAHSRRALLRRVDSISRRTPRHSRPQLSPLMRAARTAATATLSAGAERVLDQLVCAPMPDEAWLQAVGEFAALNARHDDGEPPRLLALLLLRPD